MDTPVSHTAVSTEVAQPADAQWPLRAWGLPFLGGAIGLAIHFLLKTDTTPANAETAALRWALAAFLATGGITFSFVIERTRLLSSLVLSVACGAMFAFATYWNGPFIRSGYDEPWRMLCAALAVAIAAPLFQAWRDRDRNESLFYRLMYDRSWSYVVLWCAAWLFVGIVWLMALLLSQLFELIGIDTLSTLLGKDWAASMLTGAALGAAAGVLRDREPVLNLIQQVVTKVLSVLAPVLAAGLALFLIALPFTGLTPLWEATKSTTPILLSCIIGALCLANAVIGADPTNESRHPAFRATITALSIALLPLGVIAALSTYTRIDQHGLTPDRLWAMVFTGIACAYGVAYFVAIIRKPSEPAPLLRSANLKLAIGLCALALLLSTPLINFGAMSVHSQLSRLTQGATSADQFDWQALRFDFGPAGVAALETLAKEGSTPDIRDAAHRALQQEARWQSPEPRRPVIKAEDLVILPHGTQLPEDLYKQLSNHDACGFSAPCVVLHEPESDEAIIVTLHTVHIWRRENQLWRNIDNAMRGPDVAAERAQQQGHALKSGQVEVRTVARRQVYVGGQPVGLPFE